MHHAVNSVGAAALAAALVCAVPTTGVADPGLKFEGGPWIPALAIVSSSPNESANESAAERKGGAHAALHAALLAFAIEPEALGESAPELQRALSEADSQPVAIPARVAIGPAPGAGDATEEEQWAPAVLVVSRADGDPPKPPSAPALRTRATRGQALEEAPRDETERWVPSLGFTNGILGQGTQGSVDSRFFIFSFEQPLRPSADGSATLLSPWVGASLELMTPGLGDVPGRPRLFAHADAAYNFGFDRDVAKEGSPGEFEPPTFPNSPPGGLPMVSTDGVVQGQGSTTSANSRPLLLTAGAGVAFTVDALGRRFRIKPSVEYLREELEIVGVVKRAALQTPGGGNAQATYSFVELGGRKRETYHGVGGGLEVETDTAKLGPLMLTLFVSGQAYRILGDRSTELKFEPEFSDLVPGHGFPEATWTFEKDKWSYRGALGMRFRWQPD